MLSFLNEDNQKNSQNGQGSGRDGNQVDQNFGEELISTEQDYLVPAEHGKNVKQSTILLAALFGIGALCVWFMTTKITPKAASASDTDSTDNISQVILGLKGIENEMSRADGITGKFFTTDIEQVNVDELKKNPFVSEFGHSVRAEITIGILKDDILSHAHDLELDSIIESASGSSCIINGKRLNEGDKIQTGAVTFTVDQITGKYVKVSANGHSVKLMML